MSSRELSSTDPDNFPSQFKSPSDSPGFLLWQITNGWQRSIRRALKETGLTHVQFVLLTSIDWLSNANLSTSQKNIAEFAHTDVMMTSQVVRTLERKGFVAVKESSTDARAHQLDVTSAGHQLVPQSSRVGGPGSGGLWHRQL